MGSVSDAAITSDAFTFGATPNEIMALEKSERTATAIKNRRLYRRVQAIDRLSRRDQEALLRTIDAFSAKLA